VIINPDWPVAFSCDWPTQAKGYTKSELWLLLGLNISFCANLQILLHIAATLMLDMCLVHCMLCEILAPRSWWATLGTAVIHVFGDKTS
jgi:hypothetical protein